MYFLCSNSILTVGARALAKHCHRDHTNSWWGGCTGSEDIMNQIYPISFKMIMKQII